jgi:mutator protein MutT
MLLMDKVPAVSPGPRVEVSAALLFQGGRLLITRRPMGSHLGGLWEFPGGKREPGETFEACLQRELREELGIRVAVGPCWATVEHAYPERTVEIRFFLCRLLSGQPRPLGCSAIKWVGRQTLRRHRFPAADTAILERLVRTPDLWREDSVPGPEARSFESQPRGR